MVIRVKIILCKMVIGKYATPKSCFDTNSFFIVSVFVRLCFQHREHEAPRPPKGAAIRINMGEIPFN